MHLYEIFIFIDMSIYNWTIFLISFFSTLIFYIFNKIRVKNLYTIWVFLKYDDFFEGDDFNNIFFNVKRSSTSILYLME